MKPNKILSYLVPVGKGQDEPEEVTGTTLPLAGSMYSMLSGVFEKAEEECKVPVRFITGGSQQNDVREEVATGEPESVFPKRSRMAFRYDPAHPGA
jgi:hypothetical protein